MTKVKDNIPTLKEKQKWFKSSKASSEKGKLRVDREKGIVYDVVIAQVGPAQGHGTNVEQAFIDELVAQGNKKSQGVKVHFGHPSMSEQTLGTYAGRAFNFSVRGDQAIAEIHLSKVAEKSPKGDLYNYLLDMAENESDVFGMSVVTSGNWLYQYDDEGNMYTEDDEDWFDKYTSTRPLYEMFKSFIDVDFVDQGALTPNGLFSIDLNMDKFAVAATAFLNGNPKIDEFIKNNPEKVVEFMSKRFGISLLKEKNLFGALKEIFSKDKSDIKPDMKKNKQNFDINAKTDDGVELTIVTAESEAKIDDEVVLSGTQDSPDNGDYNITESDDEKLVGQTVTIQEGLITAINPTPADASTTGADAGTNAGAEYSEKKGKTLEERFSALESEVSSMREENKKLRDENEELKKRPKSVHTPIVKTEDGNKQAGKKETVTSYNKAAQEAFDKRKKRNQEN